MNDTDVSKQIQQMVRFIRQEAEEKANEISVSAEETNPLEYGLIMRNYQEVRSSLENPRMDGGVSGIVFVARGSCSMVDDYEPDTSLAVIYFLHQVLHGSMDLPAIAWKGVLQLFDLSKKEFNIEKLQLVEAEKKKIRQEYERKAKQVEVRKKIEYSMQLNASRIKVLQAQDDLVNFMKDSASKELLRVSSDKKAYKKLLKGLIVQSLLRLKEPSVLLRCRELDVALVESVLEEAKKEYAEKAKVHAPKVTVDKQVYLPPPPTDSESHGPSCSGGVVLASQDGKIVCENTLDARLDVVFRQKLPVVRISFLGFESLNGTAFYFVHFLLLSYCHIDNY
ncbi:hypothetical protein RJ640_010377 [Escallonia rubra]|uniref:Vacuolar ATP synthase subunit E n=1 Tax=Escallonia rubra TaxID=112253 RepID=A0AA88RGL5_9ASTE|nr:hypothetical protein RJ640_010377 [Escallonia rubra]